MTRILVLGAGQLGRALGEHDAPDERRVVVLDRKACDIRRADAVAAALDRYPSDVVINTAAYTQVDRAESESASAFEVNAQAAGLVAEAAADRNLLLVHVSTDYVFDGLKPTPYTEADAVNPLGVYARSKERGEQLVRQSAPRHVIVRTAWLYAPNGRNFARTMIARAASGEPLRVVSDQFGSPTSALVLARALLRVAEVLAGAERDRLIGTYHIAGAGSTSWHGFACEIFRQWSSLLGVPSPQVVAIPSRDYPTPAPRPSNSALDCSRFEATFGYALGDWRLALPEVLERLEPPAGQEAAGMSAART